MDYIIMAFSRFFYKHNDAGAGTFYVKGMGIHEKMSPGIIRHGGPGYPYLFTVFHDRAWINVDTAPENAEKGFFLWPMETYHVYGNENESWDHSWLYVRGESIAPMLARNHFPANQLLFFNMENIFVNYLKLIYAEVKKQPRQDSYMLEGIVMLLFHELARAWRHGRKLIPDNILAAEEYIQKNFHRNLALGDIARISGLSIPRFTVIFKQYYGEPPVQYLIRTRIERAAKLLQYKNLRIKQVALETGFADQLYFSRKFREYFSCSPREFRNNQ